MATNEVSQDAVENVHKVPSKQWKKWSPDQRKLFNGVRSKLLLMGPQITLPPEVRSMSKKHFDVIAWNSAWTAADQLGEI